jgi:hypothetical protein
MYTPTNHPLHFDTLEINGVKFSGAMIPQILGMITNPDPTCWYRFERQKDNTILVETKHEILRPSTAQPDREV